MRSQTTTWHDGPTLSAWIYDTPRGAAAGQVRLHRLSHRGAVRAVDAATATWVKGAHRPRISTLPVGALAAGPTPASSRAAFLHHHGSPVATLLGRLALTADGADGADGADVSDVAGAAETGPAGGPGQVPALLRALAWELRGSGLDESFLGEVRDAIVPDSSALLVLSRGADRGEIGTVIERGLVRGDVRVLHAPLTDAGLPLLAALVRGPVTTGTTGP